MIHGIGGGTNGVGYATQLSRSGMGSRTSSSGSAETADALFSSADLDGDGVISASELMSAVNGATETGMDGFFPSGNATESGMGAYGYLGMSGMNGMGGMAPPPPPPAGEAPDDGELFSQTDANGDGVITETELTEAISAMGGNGPDPAELFALMDADGDGAVTEEEHGAGLASLRGDSTATGATDSGSLFTVLDADGDGTVTETEYTEGMAALKEEKEAQRESERVSEALFAAVTRKYQLTAADISSLFGGSILNTTA